MSVDYISEDSNLTPYRIGGAEGFMSEDSALKLADALTIVSAACCIVGVAPSIARHGKNCTQFTLSVGDSDTDRLLPIAQAAAVADSICTALDTGKLKPACLERPQGEAVLETRYNIWGTIIDVDELKRWLLSRNCKPPFFFGTGESNKPDYLDNKHPSFSLEIAAAIQAWEAIQDPELRKGKTVKAAATVWLTTNYRELDLIHNGKCSSEAIKRIATLVNWQRSGGSPKTPG
jgi:hypothetical protein